MALGRLDPTIIQKVGAEPAFVEAHLKQMAGEKAYEIWQQMGYPNGQSVEHWLQAEKELIDLKI